MPSKEQILERAREMAEQGMNPPPPPIQPQPVPLAVSVGQGQMPDGSLAVVLVIHSPVGQNVFFLDAENAKGVADGLSRAAQASGAGLVVPN